MADPNSYQPGFSYAGYELENPAEPKPGAELDNDFANIATAVGEAVEAIKDVRRSDGALENGIVTYDSLTPALQILLGANEYVEAIVAIGDDIAAIGPITAEIQIAADNIDDINTFSRIYQGSKATPPTLRNNGDPLVAGDLYFDNVANVLKVYDLLGQWIEGSGAALAMIDDSFTGDGSENEFTLSYAPVLDVNVLVFVGGVRQVPGTDYTTSGTTLTLAIAPEIGIGVDTVVLATTASLTTPADGSVVAATLTNDGTALGAIRTKLGLGDSALLDVGTGSGEVAAGDHGHTSSDISNFSTSVQSIVSGLIGSSLQAYDVDTLKSDTSRTLTVGYPTTDYSFGTRTSGTFTPSIANGATQYGTNGGNHTLAPPSNSCSLVLHYTNNSNAGTITTSGFTKVDGATPTTTNGHQFLYYITRVNSRSHLTIVALQ